MVRRMHPIGWTTAVFVALALLFAAPRLLLAAPAPQQSGDPVVVAAGDIAACCNDEDYQTAYLLDTIEGTVLTLGDNAYEAGALEEYNAWYEPTWGRHKARTRPVPGNHEYATQGAEGYFTYFGDVATPLEPGCRRDCGGYYSFDLGAWHIIALNSEVPNDPGSPQEQWLRADLAAHPTTCTLAYWHRPRFTSGRYFDRGAAHGLWQALYDYGADVVLVGHDHDYERFAPQGPGGEYEPTRGIRQFVVGTGGDTLRDFRFIQSNSEVRNSETWGVIKLTLHPESYDWEFVPIPGQTFRDAGSAPCVKAETLPPPPATTTTVAVVEPAPVPAAAPSSSAAAAAPAAGGETYVVQSGDTLSAIGARLGLAWTAIAAANGLSEGDFLQVGQVLRLSASASAPAAPALTSSTAPTVTATAAPAAATPAPAAAAGSAYAVQPGDTLSTIAARYGLSWQALAAANGLEQEDVIRIGQRLTIPAAGAPAAIQTTAQTPAAATGASRTHTVANGETLIGIAGTYGLDWRRLLQLNELTENSILQIGQELQLE